MTTQGYAHLRPDMFRAFDLPALPVDLSRGGGAVIDMAAHREGASGVGGNAVATPAVDEEGGGSISSDSS
jgi:hypothetical protein